LPAVPARQPRGHARAGAVREARIPPSRRHRLLVAPPPVGAALLQAGVVDAFDVSLELVRPEVDLAQVARAVAFGLVVEVGRIGMAAGAAGGDRAGAHPLAELDHGDEAVAVGAVVTLRARVTARAERGQRAPAR